MLEKLSIITNWASEFKDLDKKLSKEFGVEIEDLENMKAKITGQKTKIINFLTSSDYALGYSEMLEEFPELAADYTNIKYAFAQAVEQEFGFADEIKWCDLDEDILSSRLYNDEAIILKDENLNKIITIDLNYDGDLNYKIFNSDVKVNTYEKIDDFDKYSFIKMGLIESVLDNSVGWNTTARDGIEQILNVAANIKRDYKNILEQYLGKENIQDIETKCKDMEYNSISAFKDIIKTAIKNHSDNQIPDSSFEDIIFCEGEVVDFVFSKLTKPLKQIAEDMGYMSQSIDLNEAMELVSSKSNEKKVELKNV